MKTENYIKDFLKILPFMFHVEEDEFYVLNYGKDMIPILN